MNENEVPCPDPNEPVTRRILQEGLQKELSKYPTKEDLSNELSKYSTKEDLTNELSKYSTKEDLTNELSKYSTKEALAKLDTKFDIHFGALHERLLTLEKTVASVLAMLQALPAEIGRQIRAIDENLRGDVKVVDEKYADLPARVAKLEADHAKK